MIDNTSLFKLSYGLFVLTAKTDKDNGCIINTATQITDSPKTICISVNKANLTHDMIMESGEFNLSVLTEEVPFTIFQRFGFQSGRNAMKFFNLDVRRSENGLYYLPEYTNAFISGKVLKTIDCGSHTMFFSEVTEAKTISDKPSVTYDYYFKNIKPKPEKKKGYVCKICGYVYEGDPLPADFICPLCKHGADDFEPLK